MISFESVGEMLDDIAMALPEGMYQYLNGGINLVPDTKRHSQSIASDLYILGEYQYDRNMGRRIFIFYGSFAIVSGHLSLDAQKEELRKILYHEFVHHFESLAGERDLEVQDKHDLVKYLNGHK